MGATDERESSSGSESTNIVITQLLTIFNREIVIGDHESGST